MTDLYYGARGIVRVFGSAGALAFAAASAMQEAADEAIGERGIAHIVLSGGSTPLAMAEVLLGRHYAEASCWADSHFYWGDERWAPLSSPESNAGNAQRALFDSLPGAVGGVHPMPVWVDSPEVAAATYQELIEQLVTPEEEIPVFDLAFLGMGTDGHTASLFPHTEALDEQDRLVVANEVAALDTIRLTMTAPLLNAARQVVFLVAGASKAACLKEVLEGPLQPYELPSQLIRPSHGSLHWYVDEEATTELSHPDWANR